MTALIISRGDVGEYNNDRSPTLPEMATSCAARTRSRERFALCRCCRLVARRACTYRRCPHPLLAVIGALIEFHRISTAHAVRTTTSASV